MEDRRVMNWLIGQTFLFVCLLQVLSNSWVSHGMDLTQSRRYPSSDALSFLPAPHFGLMQFLILRICFETKDALLAGHVQPTCQQKDSENTHGFDWNTHLRTGRQTDDGV